MTLFGQLLSRDRGREDAWAVQRRRGDHWMELGHYAYKILARQGLARAITEHQAEPEDLRIARRSRRRSR